MDDCRPRWRAVGRVAALVILLAGLATGCAAARGVTSSGKLPICEISANSGPFSQLGTNDELGAAAWAAKVNRSGGLLGHPVELVKEDDASDPATAAALVHKCVSQTGANFIFGPEETATASAAIPIANVTHAVLLGWQSGWNGQGISDKDLHSSSFPGIGNVFFADDLATVTQLIAPRHYTRVAVIEDNSPGGLGNDEYTASLGPKYGFKVVASQMATPGATDDTPQALALLKAHPQIIVLGLTPGPDTITAIKAIRAQDPSIPISECSGCATSSFIAAVGGPSAMKNVYLIGTPYNMLTALRSTKSASACLADTRNYIAAMKAAGLNSSYDIDEGMEGWDTGRELSAAVAAAHSVQPAAVQRALAHQSIVTGGIQCYYWHRSPADYSAMSQIESSVVTVAPDGTFTVLPHVGS